MPYFDGYSFDPDYGLEWSRTFAVSDRLSLPVSAQFFFAEDGINGSLAGADPESVPGFNERNTGILRMAPTWQLWNEHSLRWGGSLLAGELENGARLGLDDRRIAWGTDLTLTLGDLSIYGEYIDSHGTVNPARYVSGGPSDRQNSARLGAAYQPGWLGVRLNHSLGWDHLCEPSPQRTPVLFQAGASKRGRAFAAKHAECVFSSGLTRVMVAEIVKDIRELAVSFGRAPDSVLIYTAFCAVTGPDEESARNRYEDYRRHVNLEGTLTLFGGYSGIDFSGVDLDLPLQYVESNAIQTFVQGFTSADPDRQWTLREIGEFLGIGGFAPIAVGDPASLAAEMALWMDETGIDGFNLIYSVSPQDVKDFVDLVVPELQRRGLYRTTYPDGKTMREKLYGPGQRFLRADHPGAEFRSSRMDGVSYPRIADAEKLQDRSQ